MPPPLGPAALSDDARLTSVCLRPRKTKIGTEVAHVTRDSDTTFKVKRSKVNLQGRGILWRPPAQLVTDGMSVYSFIAYGSSKNWIEHYKSRPIH